MVAQHGELRQGEQSQAHSCSAFETKSSVLQDRALRCMTCHIGRSALGFPAKPPSRRHVYWRIVTDWVGTKYQTQTVRGQTRKKGEPASAVSRRALRTSRAKAGTNCARATSFTRLLAVPRSEAIGTDNRETPLPYNGDPCLKPRILSLHAQQNDHRNLRRYLCPLYSRRLILSPSCGHRRGRFASVVMQSRVSNPWKRLLVGRKRQLTSDCVEDAMRDTSDGEDPCRMRPPTFTDNICARQGSTRLK